MSDPHSPLPRRQSVREAKEAKKKTLSGTHKALIGLLVLALILAGVGGAIFITVRNSVNSQITHIHTSLDAPSSKRSQSLGQSHASAQATTFLIMGSDSRHTGGELAQWKRGDQRSDVLMLAQIEAGGTGLNIMSIPRDSWVDIPGYGKGKINAAFSYGGPDLAIQTVENLVGITIDHFMMTDFASFSALTDALGGVSIPTAQGTTLMNGDQALAYVRERYSLPRGDFDRVQRQQAWMRAIVQKAFSQSLLTNPAKLSKLIGIITKYSALDQNLDFTSLLGIASGLTGLRSNGITFFTLPYSGTATSEDGQSIVEINRDALPELEEAWRNGTLSEYITTHTDLDVLGSQPAS